MMGHGWSSGCYLDELWVGNHEHEAKMGMRIKMMLI